MTINRPQSFWHEDDVGLAILRGVSLQKLVGQQHCIISALPQWRQTDDQHGQSEVEIFAERSLVDRTLQIDVSRGDNPSVAVQFLSSTYALKTLFLQKTK